MTATINRVPRQYREVSVTAVDFPLTAERVSDYLLGREVYKRTRFAVLRCRADTAVAEVASAPGDGIMAVVTDVSVLALPPQCRFVTAPEVDTGIPSSLARAARELAPGVPAVVVEGRYHHINFILDPAPQLVRVVDVVPPGPPKLLDQAARLLEIAEELPPMELVGDIVDLADLADLADRARPVRARPDRAGSHAAARYLLPCRGSGFEGDVAFLDERPAREDWTLIGCSRSRELHRWFYGDLPPNVEMCPRVLAAVKGSGAGVTLTKCCLLEDGIECDRNTVVVPWGASLDQVRQALRAAAALASAAPSDDPQPPREATWSRA